MLLSLKISIAIGAGIVVALPVALPCGTCGAPLSGEPELVSGMLGLVERNAMRYFLAVDAYLAAPDNFEKRLSLWYAATEKYPRQLHDLSEADYLKFKRADRERQGSVRP